MRGRQRWWRVKRGEPCHVGRENRRTSRPERVEGTLHVHRVPGDDRVHDQPEGGALVFLPLAVALPHRAALVVKDHPRAAMAPLPAIERGQAAPSVRRVAGGVAQDV